MAIQPSSRERESLARLLVLAREEDLGPGDATAGVVPEGARLAGRFVAREPLVVCGAALLEDVAAAYAVPVATTVLAGEGAAVEAGEPVAAWAGPARAILAAERVALNILQRLSGIATLTRRYVDAVAGTGAAIYDTRKTTPGWRVLEKYAVRAGGGRNHRMGLYDGVLVKDNHLAALGEEGSGEPIAALAESLAAARAKLGPDALIEVEVDTLEQLERALALPVNVVLLDNMPPERLREAVAVRDAAGLRGRVALEASGGVGLGNVRAVAESGVERISVGALTHSAPAVDIGLDVGGE